MRLILVIYDHKYFCTLYNHFTVLYHNLSYNLLYHHNLYHSLSFNRSLASDSLLHWSLLYKSFVLAIFQWTLFKAPGEFYVSGNVATILKKSTYIGGLTHPLVGGLNGD